MGRGLGSYIRKADENYILTIDKCLYCGAMENLHIDHIFPLNKGGISSLDNLTRACKNCNSYKWNFTIEVFLERSINHREECYSKALYFLRKLDRAKRRGNKEEYPKIINKYQDFREKFRYFNRIVWSITKGNYMPKKGILNG